MLNALIQLSPGAVNRSSSYCAYFLKGTEETKIKTTREQKCLDRVVVLIVNSRHCALLSCLKRGPKPGGVLDPGQDAGMPETQGCSMIWAAALCPRTALKGVHSFPGISMKLSTKSPCFLSLKLSLCCYCPDSWTPAPYKYPNRAWHHASWSRRWSRTFQEYVWIPNPMSKNLSKGSDWFI